MFRMICYATRECKQEFVEFRFAMRYRRVLYNAQRYTTRQPQLRSIAQRSDNDRFVMAVK